MSLTYCEVRFVQDLLNGAVEGFTDGQLCWGYCQPKPMIACLHKKSLFSSAAAATQPQYLAYTNKTYSVQHLFPSTVVPSLLTCGQLYMFFAFLRLAAMMQSRFLTNAYMYCCSAQLVDKRG